MTRRTEGKIKTDYGINDYYKFYCNNTEKPVSKIIFNKVITSFNEGVVNLMINDNLEFIPTTLQMNFCIRKSQRIPRIVEGKLINTNPIDWKTTKQLWLDDEDAREKKILIRYLNNHTSKHVFRIKIARIGYLYKNKNLYRFKACRSFQRALGARILDKEQDNFNAFNLY